MAMFFLLGMAVKACRDLATMPAAGDPSTEPLDVCCLGKRVCHPRMGASGCRARDIWGCAVWSWKCSWLVLQLYFCKNCTLRHCILSLSSLKGAQAWDIIRPGSPSRDLLNGLEECTVKCLIPGPGLFRHFGMQKVSFQGPAEFSDIGECEKDQWEAGKNGLVSAAGLSIIGNGIFWWEAETKRLFSQCKPYNHTGLNGVKTRRQITHAWAL